MNRLINWTKLNLRRNIKLSILVVSIVGIGLFLILSGKIRFFADIQKPDNAAILQGLAQANKMQLLGADQVAILKKELDTPSEGKTTQTFRFSDGFTRNLTSDKILDTMMVEDKANQNIFVSPENTEIHNLNQSLFNPDPSKIDSNLAEKIKKDKQAKVIIRLNSLEQSYLPSDSQDKRKEKKDKFLAKKSKVENLIKKHGKIENELLIINGLGATIDQTALENLSQSPEVMKISLDIEVKALLDTSLDEINVKEVWPLSDLHDQTLTGKGMRIAILDTGIDYTHPDLGGCFGPLCKVIGGYDFINQDNDPIDDNGHGTHVAGIAAGNGSLKGAAPDAKLIAYKVLGAGGKGTVIGIVNGVQKTTDPNGDGDPADHFEVGSMSIGSIGGNPDDEMSTAVDVSSAAGVAWTIAAGNTGPSASSINSPGTARSAITVAAACKSWQIDGYTCVRTIANFSSRGPLIWNNTDIQKPDVAAPGVQICSAMKSGLSYPYCFSEKHYRMDGTSMATPHVAGGVALIRQAYPRYSPAEVKQLLKSTARSLGMDYNSQGTGMVNLKAAINPPLSQKLNIQPNHWQFSTDPTLKNSVSTKTISVTPNVDDISSLELSNQLNVTGITVALDKSTLNVAGRSTDSFTITVDIDNDVVKPEPYLGFIEMKQNGVTISDVLIDIMVLPTLTLSTNIIDYGIDIPGLTEWRSEPKIITVRNLRNDKEQTITSTPNGFPVGVTLNIGPSYLVPASSSIDISTQLIVNNSQVANNIYKNFFTLASPQESLLVNTQFIKFYVLTIKDNSIKDPGTLAQSLRYIWIHDRQVNQLIKNYPANPTIFYLNSPSVDLMFNFSLTRQFGNKTENSEYTIVKEGISINSGSANVEVNYKEATNLVEMSGVDENNAPMPLNIHHALWTYVPNPTVILILTSLYTTYDTSKNYYSNISPNYKSRHIFHNPEPSLKLYYFSDTFTGINQGRKINNEAKYFKVASIKSNNNMADGERVWPSIQESFAGETFQYGEILSSNALVMPIKQTVFSMMAEGVRLEGFLDNLTHDWSLGKTRKSSRFDLATGNRYHQTGHSLPNLEEDIIYNSFGPPYFAGKFSNDATKISLYSLFDNTYGMRLAPLSYQDYSPMENNTTLLTLNKDGQQLFASLMGQTSFWNIPNPLIYNLASAGNYEFKVDSFPYQIKGKNMNAKMTAKFNTSLSDRNPPAITRFNYFVNGTRNEIYNENVENRLEFETEAMGGTLADVKVGFSSDGTNFNPVTVNSENNRYRAVLPQIAGLNKITLKIEIFDSSNNSFEYAFEIPREEIETVAPIGSLQIEAGAIQTSNKLAKLNLSASDNGYVDKMRFSNNNAGWSGWLTFRETYWQWDLTDSRFGGNAQEGPKNVFVQFMDRAGNVSAGEISDSINYVYDRTPPVFNSQDNGIDIVWGTDGKYIVKWPSASDPGGAMRTTQTYHVVLVPQYNYSSPIDKWYDGENTVQTEEINFAGNKYTVTVTAYDAVGNSAEISRKLDTPPIDI